MNDNSEIQEEKKIILVVEDDPTTQRLEREILENAGFRVFFAPNAASANRQVAAYLKQGKYKISLVIMDLDLGVDSGEELLRRLRDIVGVNVLIVSGNTDEAAKLSFQADDVLIKPFNVTSLVEMVERLIEPLHRNKLSQDVKLNLWLATQHLRGFRELTPFTRVISGEDDRRVEKIHLRTKEKIDLSPTVYPPQGDMAEEACRICIGSLIGCPVGCLYCVHPISRFDNAGCQVCFLRELTIGELAGQIYAGMLSPLVREVFEDFSNKSLVVNISGEGEGFSYNFDNLMTVITQICKATKPKVEVIVTTTGNEEMFQKFIDKGYTALPITFYYSLIFADAEARERFMRGTKGHSVERELDLLELIAMMTRRPTTIAITVFKGFNDSSESVKEFAALLKDRSPKWFKIKLQKGAEGSLDGPDTSDQDVADFEKELIKAGVKHDIRIRNIEGDEFSGCGRTRTHWETQL